MATIPNVIVRWCRKPAICAWCDKVIDVGTPEVVVIFWNKGNPENRSFNKKFYYHFSNKEGKNCYVQQAQDYLNRNPFVPHRRGRKVTLNEEDRRKRFLLVRKFHALVQRKKNIKADYPDRLITENNLTEQMTEIAKQMLDLGGVPKSWASKFM